MGRRIKRSKKVVRTVSRKNSNRRMTQRRVNKRRMTQRRVNKRRMTKRNVARRIKRTNRKILKTLKRLRGGDKLPNPGVVALMFEKKEKQKNLLPRNRRINVPTRLAAQRKAEKEAEEEAEEEERGAEQEQEAVVVTEGVLVDGQQKPGAGDIFFPNPLKEGDDRTVYRNPMKPDACVIVRSNPLVVDDPDDETSMEGGGYNRTNQNRRK